MPPPSSSFLNRKEEQSREETEAQNHAVLRECLSGPIIQKLVAPLSGKDRAITNAAADRRHRRKRAATGPASSGRATVVGDQSAASSTATTEVEAGGVYEDRKEHERKSEDDHDAGSDAVEDLVDFVDYLATELFASLPGDLRSLDYDAFASNSSIQARYPSPLPQTILCDLLGMAPNTVADSMIAYRLLPSHDHLSTFLTAVLNDYVSQVVVPPPSIALATPLSSSASSSASPSAKAQLGATRPSACELCERDWIPLTYHHLIPRSTHEKVLKRGWHPEWRLNAVAWICRACHDFVHGIASNEELAKQWWSLDRIRAREDAQIWIDWVGRVRWKKR